MLIRTTPIIPTREITDERQYLDRRAFIRTSIGAAAGGVAGVLLTPGDVSAQAPIPNVGKGSLTTTGEALNSFEDITVRAVRCSP